MKSFFSRLLKRWYAYIIAIFFGTTLSCLYVDVTGQHRAEETITFFVSTYSTDDSKARAALTKDAPSYLKEVNLVNIPLSESNWEYYFVNRGLNHADVFVLPESRLTSAMLTEQFALLKPEVLSSYFSYEAEETGHGIYLHHKGENKPSPFLFTSEERKDENFYVLFRKNSIHIGGLYAKSSHDTALTMVKHWIDYEA